VRPISPFESLDPGKRIKEKRAKEISPPPFDENSPIYPIRHAGVDGKPYWITDELIAVSGLPRSDFLEVGLRAAMLRCEIMFGRDRSKDHFERIEPGPAGENYRATFMGCHLIAYGEWLDRPELAKGRRLVRSFFAKTVCDQERELTRVGPRRCMGPEPAMRFFEETIVQDPAGSIFKTDLIDRWVRWREVNFIEPDEKGHGMIRVLQNTLMFTTTRIRESGGWVTVRYDGLRFRDA
jgi:hypothetical protein